MPSALHELERQNQELRQAQAELGAARTRYFDLYDRAPVGYCIQDENGLILEANLTTATLLDTSRAALAQQSMARFILKEDQAIYDRHRKQLFETGAPQTCELRMTKRDGTVFWTHLVANLVPDANGAPACRMVVADITPHKRTEQFLRCLYVVLAQVNRAILHFQEQQELFREICRIAIQSGRFRLAWVGLVDTPTGQLKPVAHDGFEEGYLKSIHINVNPNSAFSQGPIGQAFLQGQVVACQDSEPAFQRSPWRNERIKRGYRALVAVPFRRKGTAIGTLNLYVDTPCFFSGEELDLMKRIGDTISFALDCLEIEKSRQRAEAAQRESEAQTQALIRAIPDLIFMNRRDGEYLAVYAPDPRLLAAPSPSILHRKIGEILPKPVADRCLKAIAAALDSGTTQELTYTLPLDGQERHFEARVAPCTQDTVLTIVRDITERNRAEAHLRFHAQLLDSVRDSMVATDLQGRIQYWGRGAEKLYGYRAEEVMNQPYRNFAGPIEPPDEEAFRRTILANGSWRGEHLQRKRNGETVWTSSFISLVADENGQPAGFIGIDQDITEYKQAEMARRDNPRQVPKK